MGIILYLPLKFPIVFENVDLHHLLFMDIETVSGHSQYLDLPPSLQSLWSEKISKIAPETQDMGTAYSERAALFAAFGRIVCISIGYFPHYRPEDPGILRLKSFAGTDEKVVLTDFFQTLSVFESRSRRLQFGGHNIQEFDIPYICRRALVNGLSLPGSLRWYNKKPWELPVVDTMRMWGFGQFRSFISLKLLAAILDIASPKDDIDGSQVGQVFWEDKDLERIQTYCQKDVVTVAQVVLRFKQQALLNEQNIEIVR